LDRASVFDIVQSQEFISHHIDVQYIFFILIYVLIYVFAYRFPEFPDLHLAPRCTKLHHAAVAAAEAMGVGSRGLWIFGSSRCHQLQRGHQLL